MEGSIAEMQRRKTQMDEGFEAYRSGAAEQRRQFEEARSGYYQSLRDEYSEYGTEHSDEFYQFVEAMQPMIDTDEDPQYLKERIMAAGMYADLYQVDPGTAFVNLENFHQQWMGQSFVRKSGLRAVGDSLQLSLVSREYNNLAQRLAKQGGTDPGMLQALQEYEQRMDQLRDHTPKVWQDDYVKLGGWDDVGQFFRSVSTSIAENAVPLIEGTLAATAAGLVTGGIAGAAGLSAAFSKVLVAGASRAAIAGSTYNSTWGIKYREMTNGGIPHDIAINYARVDALIEGIIEGSLGGVEVAGAQAIMGAVVPQAVGRATTRFFVSGKMGSAAKGILNWLKEGIEEGSEEVLQSFSSGGWYNAAADAANARREELLRKIVEPEFEEIRRELERELENLPEVEKKKWKDIFDEAIDGGIAGFLTGVILGIPVEIASYRNDVRAAQTLASMAQAAPNEAAFKEMVSMAKEQGFQLPIAEEMKTDEEASLLSDIYKVQQERLTPEQREAKQKQAQDAAALAEVTDYSNAETVERLDEETGGTITELARPDTSNIYRENNRLEINEYTDTNEDGSISGRFVAGDPRIEDAEQSGANRYGNINYTENGNTVTIDEFKMSSGYENLRTELYSQFAERFAGRDIVWNIKNEQNTALREQLANQNPRGPKYGLNYYEKGDQPQASNEARQVAQRFQPYLKNSTPLETALAAELFNNFYRRRGESLNGAMSRLLGKVTNDPNENPKIAAAQRMGNTIKGATWFDKTAEGMKRIVYLNKNAADASTVIHETSHIVANDFTEAERRIASRALDGYKLKNGTSVYFEENTQWTDEQHEAFAEALENYLTNGKAPNEQIKGLFERIKEFMKRIYQIFKGWTELSPQAEEFYKSFLSGELVDQARTEAAQTHEESHNEAKTENTVNNTERASEAAEAPQEAAKAKSPNATSSHTEALINNPDIPLEEKAQAVFDAAGDALWQIGEVAAEELNKIYEQYHNEDGTAKEGWLKAPNGKSTNLTENQWLMVRTENFKNWFGDWENNSDSASKIIDENGEPQSVHRGDHAEKDRFTNRQGVYFAAEKTVAEDYASGGLYEVFLDIKNPLDLDEKTFSEVRERINDMLVDIYEQDWSELEHNEQFQTLRENYLAFRNEEGSAVQDFYNDFLPEVSEDTDLDELKDILLKSVHDANTFEWQQIDYKDIDILNPFIKTLGYDGIVRPYDPLGQSNGNEYVTFEPNQIKSATDNVGTFDPNNPSTLFQTAYQGSPYIFDKFNNSYVGSGWGNLHHGWGHYLYSQKEAAEWFGQSVSKIKGVEGQLYHVDIPDDHELLHWDKTISEQSEAVQKAADRLITWNKKDKSDFNEVYNLRKFDDGSYGFLTSINGKMKWATKAEAQDAAKAEIKKTLTGKEFYNTLSKSIGAKETSLLLDHLGVKGSKYLDKSIEKIGVQKSFNYVIFGDSEININGKDIAQAAMTQTADGHSNQPRFAFNLNDNALIPYTQTLFQIRTEPPPKKTGTAYKVFYYKDGKLYPAMVNPTGQPTPVGVWLNAEEGVKAGTSKTGRLKVKAGGKGTQGGGGTLAYRPGWHLGEVPRAAQFDREKPSKDADGKFPKDFVWAEVEYADDIDYQDEARSYGMTENGKYRHSYAGLPRIPKDGSYRYRTNPNPKTEPWIISGAMRVIRVLGDSEVNEILKKNGIAPIERQGGAKEAEDFAFTDETNEISTMYNTDTLFQSEDRNMLEEAADFENGKDYRGFIETFYGLPQEVEGFTDEQIDAWFEEFVQKAKQAVNTSEQIQETISKEKATPAELDREFNEMISEPGVLEDFVEITVAMYNQDYSQWGAMDEEDAAERDRQSEISYELRRKLTHPTWQSIIKAQGKMGQTQRKQLLTMIKNSPREYRAIYAGVMEREDMAVSAEDSTAAALKYRITDSRRQDVDSLTPEKLRQLAEQLDIDDFAEKVRSGRAQFNDPIEKSYIKQLQEKINQGEEKLKEVSTDRQEDNKYIERLAGKQFLQTFERAIKAHEDITRRNEKLDKAIKTGEKDAARIARQLQRANSNYDSIMQTLQALARAQQLEIDIQEALSNEEIKDYAKSAKTQSTLQKHLAVKAATEKLKAHIAELKEKQQNAKELTEAKRGVTKRILRPINPRQVNADQGRAIAIIQRLVEPSMLEGLDRFIGGIEKPYLRTIFETWKVDEKLRADILKDKATVTQEKISSLFSKEKFEELTNDEKKYLFKKIPPNDWATALGLEDIIKRRNENFPNINGETEKQIALKHLPSDTYYRIMEKPFSEWTLSEAEELAKIIDNLNIEGKEIYKANIDAERRRIREYQNAVRTTVRTVIKNGMVLNDMDEVEKIIGKYDEGAGGIAQSAARRRKFKGPLFGYADMNVYRFARMLDNGDTNGKNTAALYRRASDAYNQEKTAIDTRTERIQNLMKELGISESELWEKSVEINLGGDLGKTTYTASELLGVLSASRDEYSREAIIYGNLLSENERGIYQNPGVTRADITPLELIAEERFGKVMEAAQNLVKESPKYQQLMDAIDEDFTAGGQRLSEALVQYNNTYMPIVEKYFPMHRQKAVSSQTADAQLARDLMGASSGAFSLFVEKGFTNKRQEIPPQYQTAIKLDILGVWAEAVNREEHFIAYGQVVKDLNQIYKQSRQVTDAIQRRYGQQAVDYINKYINELANPNPEKIRSSLDNFVRSMRGNTAAAYLGWKASGIVKQFITSPAPFFTYMNPIEYWGTFVEFTTHQESSWQEITELSKHMKHRSANLLVEMVKEKAKQKFDNKADAFIGKFNERGMKGLEWIDRMCVAPGWLVLYRKEYNRLTKDSASTKIDEKDIRVRAAQYADDIVRLTQPSSRVDDLSPFFKGNTELGKAMLQFTASLNVIWQNIRYDLPQMIRERRFNNAAGTIIGYTIAGIMLGAITAGFDDDDDEAMKIKKIAWWATTQFTDAFPIIGSEATHFAELLVTGKMQYSSGINLLPTLQKGLNAGQTAVKGLQQGEFEKLLKAAAQAAEAAGTAKGLPVSGIKELGALLGIGDGGLDFNPGALVGRRD